MLLNDMTFDVSPARPRPACDQCADESCIGHAWLVSEVK